jgi:teichuronic acid biosynthesis glycosyltransferase TuaG
MLQKLPAVSIVMPVYNRPEYIRQAIDSVIAQSTPDWELIIVDDASKDGSREVAEEYAARDPRIRVYSLPVNSGNPARPRNVGMDKAQSNLIAFIDSDDVWHSEKLSRQLDFMRMGDYAFTFTSLHVVNPDGSFRLSNPTVPAQVTAREYLANTCIVPSTVIFDRTRFTGPIRFNESLKVHEDFDLFYRMLKQQPAYGLDENLLAYRRGHASVSKSIVRVAFAQAKKYKAISREVGVVVAATTFVTYASRALSKRVLGSYSPLH